MIFSEHHLDNRHVTETMTDVLCLCRIKPSRPSPTFPVAPACCLSLDWSPLCCHSTVSCLWASSREAELCGMCLFCPLSLILCHWEDLEQRLKGGAVTVQSHTTWGQSPHMPGAYPQHVEVSLQETSKLRNTKQVRMCRGTL